MIIMIIHKHLKHRIFVWAGGEKFPTLSGRPLMK